MVNPIEEDEARADIIRIARDLEIALGLSEDTRGDVLDVIVNKLTLAVMTYRQLLESGDD